MAQPMHAADSYKLSRLSADQVPNVPRAVLKKLVMHSSTSTSIQHSALCSQCPLPGHTLIKQKLVG